MLRNVIKTLKDGKVYGSADTINHEGFKAWDMSDESKIRQLCMVGVTGNTFYADEKKLIGQATELLDKVAKENPILLAESIVECRNKGYIRTMNILGLVYLSKYDTAKFKQVFNEVVKTGNDLGDFLDMCHASRGFGRAVKTAISKWLESNVTEFYAIKYGKQIKDAIRIARPKSDNPIYDWVMGKNGDYIHFTEQIQYYESAKCLIKNGDWDSALDDIQNGKLDFATLTSYGNPSPTAWKSLTKNMGIMALLKYFNKLDEEAVWDDEMIEWLKSRFTVEALKKAKVFPFRLFIAYMNLNNLSVSQIVAETLDKYVTEYDWGKWGGKFIIAPDVSGSMTSAISGSSLTPAVIAGMFSGILYKGVTDSRIMAWDTEVYKYDNPRQDSVITHIKAIAGANGGGTHMEIPLIAMIHNKLECDYLIQITDSEEYGKGWLVSWAEYKKLYPHAKAIIVRVDGYNTQPFDDATSEKHNIYQIFGWNDSVLGFIENVVL